MYRWLLIFTTGCIQIGGSIEDVCLQQGAIAIEGAPAELREVQGKFVQEDFDLLEPIMSLDTEIYFTNAVLTGSEDLAFVRSIHLAGGASDMPSIDLARCDGDCSEGAEVSLYSAFEQDVMPYLETGAIEFSMTVAGELPREDWTMDVEICLRGDVHYRAGL